MGALNAREVGLNRPSGSVDRAVGEAGFTRGRRSGRMKARKLATIDTPGSESRRHSRLERWVELSLDLLYSVSAEGYLAELNPAWERTFGWTREELMTRPLTDFVHHADLDTTVAQFDRINEHHPLAASFENRFRCADGRYRWLSWSATTDGLGWFGVAQDITSRRAGEERLRASETQYRLLFDRNPQPLWVYDKVTLRILAVNDAAVATYGYSREELLAMSILDLRPPGDRRSVSAHVTRSVTGAPANHSPAPRLRHRKKDGTIIDVEITGNDLSFDGRPGRLMLARAVGDR
jgi:two-component system, cell cycle sensor histidine kinase and response regulator CckA